MRDPNFRVELAAFVDFGEHMAKSTYFLEGDAPLIFFVVKQVDCLLNLEVEWQKPGHTIHPRLSTLASEFELQAATGGAGAVVAATLKQLVIDAGRIGVQPSIDYMTHGVATDEPIKKFLIVARVATLFDPQQAPSFKLVALPAQLAAVPFVSVSEQALIKAEVPFYLAYLASFPANFFSEFDGHRVRCYILVTLPHNMWWLTYGSGFGVVVCLRVRVQILHWWATDKHVLAQFPAMSRTALLMALVGASSAQAERVFSLYQLMISDTQLSALEEYVSASIMLRANENWRMAEAARRNLFH